jgi:hypothetical protein
MDDAQIVKDLQTVRHGLHQHELDAQAECLDVRGAQTRRVDLFGDLVVLGAPRKKSNVTDQIAAIGWACDASPSKRDPLMGLGVAPLPKAKNAPGSGDPW